MNIKKIKERINKYEIGFIEGKEGDYILTEPWIYYSVLIHAYFDTQEGIQWDGFEEEDPNLLEDHKENEPISLKEHSDKWINEDKDVISFRYHATEGNQIWFCLLKFNFWISYLE